ncbi:MULTISPECIES: hypothetical protein [Pseudonocardia]|uniref:Uncharacterized protein n=1 Tax=Pseudonocardia autotrophica TaxID=2074 RepID=A0A1Y2MQS0_PSEAH|nr:MULTISPECIES: hypothetical protein [Pseudonocardia]OSY36848.1 hypothetical protein BG845_05120 [Pseudonocardia autotrophica]TDN76839.1 hypothetical protein C8E95_6058 [Pseudonocardia autotrophica]
MHDRTAEIADRLRTDPRIVALVLGAPWRRAAGDGAGAGADAGGAGDGDTNGAGAGAGADDIDGAGAGPRTGPQTTAASGDRADGRGRMYVGVPSPAELTELDLPVDGLRHFGLSPADLRAGGWTDTDLRSAGLTPPGAEPEPVEWFLAGEPAQLMLAIVPPGPPLLARPEPGSGAGGFDPADVQEIPGIDGCTDPESDGMLLVREIRDGLVRRARRRLVHCVVCLRQVHRTDPATGVCPGCAAQWLGVLP